MNPSHSSVGESTGGVSNRAYACTAMKIGIVGLGYVGLPLAVAFAEAGHEVIGLDPDAAKVESLNAGRSYVEDVPDAALAPLGDRLRATSELRRAECLRRGGDLRPDPADRLPRARPHLPARAAEALAAVLSSGQLVVLESTTYPGTTREQLLPILEAPASASATDFHLAFSPERIDPGRTDYTIRTTPKLVGGMTAACTERARELYALICDEVVVALHPGGRRALEAARERLPLGQHRLRQRALPALRPARDRRLGGDRRGLDQALRLHALRPRPGDGRPLPPRRPLLPRLQGPRARLLPGVHRARREDQPGPAGLLRRADRARPQRGRQAGQGLEDPHPRRQLQGRHRRHARVPGAGDPAAAARARRRTSPTTTPSSRSCPSSASLGRPRRRPCLDRPGRDRHRPPRHRLRRGRRHGTAGAGLPRRHPRTRGENLERL